MHRPFFLHFSPVIPRVIRRGLSIVISWFHSQTEVFCLIYTGLYILPYAITCLTIPVVFISRNSWNIGVSFFCNKFHELIMFCFFFTGREKLPFGMIIIYIFLNKCRQIFCILILWLSFVIDSSIIPFFLSRLFFQHYYQSELKL